MSQLELLWQLQNCDNEIVVLEKELNILQEGEDIQKLYLKLRQREYDRTNTNTQIEVNNAKIRRNNKKLEDLNYKLKEIENKLYSGNVTDVKQLEVLNSESKALKDEIERIESETLSLMETVEILKKNSVIIEKEFDEVTENLKEAEEELKVKINEMEEKIHNLEDRREDLAKELDSNILNKYKDLKESKGKAVVKVSDARCGGCHMNIPLYIVSKLKKNDNVSYCDNCGRILYYCSKVQ